MVLQQIKLFLQSIKIKRVVHVNSKYVMLNHINM